MLWMLGISNAAITAEIVFSIDSLHKYQVTHFLDLASSFMLFQQKMPSIEGRTERLGTIRM
jgi:hypothetical protein